MWEDIHDFRFYKLVVSKIHYVGGFGGSHYIGWISPNLFQSVPKTSKCKDWGSSCDITGLEICCPMDNDNKMHNCCDKFNKHINYSNRLL